MVEEDTRITIRLTLRHWCLFYRILYLGWVLELRKNDKAMARKKDLTMGTPTCQSIEVEKSMGMNDNILANHLVVEFTIGEVVVWGMKIQSEWI